jgi:hypothetical protein
MGNRLRRIAAERLVLVKSAISIAFNLDGDPKYGYLVDERTRQRAKALYNDLFYLLDSAEIDYLVPESTVKEFERFMARLEAGTRKKTAAKKMKRA